MVYATEWHANVYPGGLSKIHPHHELSKQKTDVKGVSIAMMHGLASKHDTKGVIIVSGEKIPHNNLKALSDSIKKLIKDGRKIATPSSKYPKESTVHFDNTNLSASTHESGKDVLFVISDANHHPVMITRRPQKNINIQGEILNDVAEYLAHEIHRMAWFVNHDLSNQIRHAPDHIAPDTSPLRHWPNHNGETSWKYPPLIRP